MGELLAFPGSADNHAPGVAAERAQKTGRRKAGTVGNGTLYPYIDRYSAGRQRVGRVTAKTARHQKLCLYRFAESFGMRQPKRMGQGDIERWMGELVDAGLEASSRRQAWSVVKGFLSWMVQQDHIRRDPTLNLSAPVVPFRLPEVLEQWEVYALYSAAPDARGRLIVLLEVQLGLRAVEVSRLEYRDVGSRAIRATGKGRKERYVPLEPEVRRALAEYLAERGTGGGPLIQSYRYPGRALLPSTLSTLMSQWMYVAGVKERAHDRRSGHALRRTAATDVSEKGVPSTVVAAFLGHADLASLPVYDRATEQRVAEAVVGRVYTRLVPIREAAG